MVHVGVDGQIARHLDRDPVRDRLEHVAVPQPFADRDDRVVDDACLDRRRAARCCCVFQPLKPQMSVAPATVALAPTAASTASSASTLLDTLMSIPLPPRIVNVWRRSYHAPSRAARSRSSMSCGARRVRPPSSSRPRSLAAARAPRVGQRHEPALADQPLVDAAEPAAVRRVDRHAERHGLAVHRPAGRDDEVGERDQALRVDGALGDDHGRQRERADVGALLLRPRDDDGVHALVAAEVLERLREERVRVAVVERDVRRRPQDDDDA